MVETVNTGGLKSFIYSANSNIRKKLKSPEELISLEINVKNILGTPKDKIMVEITRIDINFYDKVLSKTGKRKNNKKNTFKKITDNKGKSNFEYILSGKYLARFSKGKSFFERIINVEGKQKIKIITPLFFGLIKQEINREEVKRIFEEIRGNKLYCSKCNYESNGIPDKFLGHYCGKNYCSDHRLPEDHKCGGLKK